MNPQIEKLYEPILTYVKKRIRQIEDAEDITQEVFYKLSKSDHKEVANIKSWIYAIAKNTIIDYYRKNKVSSNEMIEVHNIFDTENDTSVHELSQCVSSFILELPQDYQNIMMLSEIQEVQQKEIAEQLNMNYATVRSKIQRGRKKLKELVTECCTISQGARGSILDYIPKRGRENCDPCSSAENELKNPEQQSSNC